MINQKFKNIYFIGIKGVGMTALAVLAKEAGIKVSGSDTDEIFVTDKILKDKGINWSLGFKPENVPDKCDLVVTTGAHGGLNNPEAIAAKRRGLKVITLAQALGLFMKDYTGISVCGVGGKSTTSAMIATILVKASFDPSYAIGAGLINPLGSCGHYGLGKYFIAEADEYVTDPKNDLTPRFMWQNPKVIVLTNLEYDHPDIYKNLEQTKETFLKFIHKLPENGFLVTYGDNKNIRQILPKIKRRVITYGFERGNDYFIDNIKGEKGKMGVRWELRKKEKTLGNFEIKLSGEHNILNASAAIIVCLELGVPLDIIKSGILSFRGVERRLEYISEVNKIKLYDDYAHHPIEIKITLKTAKELFPDKRIVCIFQPHTYSRTKALFNDFAKSFDQADLTVLTDTYASAREKKADNVSISNLVSEIKKSQPNVLYFSKLDEIIDNLKQIVKPNDVVITMGAGDIFNYHQKIINELKKVK